MNVESLRTFLFSLPHVAETMQWGDNLVFWVGDKAIGGKMFAVAQLSAANRVMSFAAGPERYAELLEVEGVFPAPYMVRNYWVSIERYDVFSSNELKDHLRNAHSIVYNKLPKRTKDVLAMPARELKKLIAARKNLLSPREKK